MTEIPFGGSKQCISLPGWPKPSFQPSCLARMERRHVLPRRDLTIHVLSLSIEDPQIGRWKLMRLTMSC